VDPNSADRALAATAPQMGMTGPYTIVQSMDGAATFGTTLYTAPADTTINSLEIARASSKIAYAIALSTKTFSPALLSTTDGGTTWQTHDLTPTLGAGSVLIIAIDPTNAMRIYLRVNRGNVNYLAVTDDGGATVRKLTFPTDLGVMTGFVRTASGTL